MARDQIFRFGDVEINLDDRVVCRCGVPAALRPKVFDLLAFLIERRPNTVLKQELLARIWPNVNVSDNSLAQCVIELRRALGDDAKGPAFIRNIPRVGYQFIAEPADSPRIARGARNSRLRVGLLLALPLAVAALLIEGMADHRSQPQQERPATTNLEARHLYSKAVEQSDSYHAAEAIAGLRRAVAIDPDFAMAQARIGYTYAVTWGLVEQGKPFLQLAYRNRDRLSAKDRLLIEAWYAIAQLDYPAAIRRYRALLAGYPGEIEAYARLGRLLRGEERYNDAITVLRRGLSADPDAPDLYNALGGIYSQLGRHEEAIAAERRYVELARAEPNSHDSLALIYQWAGRYHEALEEYQEALRLRPDFDVAVVNLGNLYFQMGRYDEALQQFTRYIAVTGSAQEKARGHGSRAWVYMRLGDWRNAAAEAAAELRLDPAAAGNSMLVALERGDRTGAGNLFGRLFTEPGYSHRGARLPRRYQYFFAGQYWLALGKDGEAFKDFREALKHWPPIGGIDPVETCLADALMKRGKFQEAAREYLRALELYPGDAPGYLHLSQAWQRLGQREKAAESYARFRQLSAPPSALAQQTHRPPGASR